jgi:predicted DNA-binding transcriptional regulator YafY
MNRIDRLTGMILLLQSRRVITAEEISAHFEISVRTVYRDIGALGEAGVPIVAEAGVGYSLAKGYHMPPVMFTEDEAAALIMGVEVTDQVADDSLRRSIGGALLKIRSVLPADRRDYVARLEKAVNVHFGSAKIASNGCDLMPMQEAVVRRRCVALRYDAGRRGELSQRVVEPLGMVFYARQWHLIGWCRLRGAFRDFRLDRVEEWKVLAETFEGHEGFSVVEFLKREREVGVEMISATIKVERAVLERFRAQAPCSPLEEETLACGRVRVSVLVYALDYLVGWLLSFGTAIEVEGPPALIGELREAALAVVAQYEK